MKFDLKKLEKNKNRNRKERLEFIESYVKWLKKTPNKVWSKQHAKFINAGIKE